MASARVAAGDEGMFTLLIRDVRKQMEPEYIVEGRAERTQGGGIKLFFTLSEKR